MKKDKIELRIMDMEKTIIKAVASNNGISMSAYIMQLIYEDLKKAGVY